MDKLEKFDLKILDNIFLRLHFLQKKECMRVCRKWRDAIKDRTYFDTVTITDEGMLFRFLSFISSKYQLGAQIKHLFLYQCVDEYFNRHINFDAFPNLEFFYIDSFHYCHARLGEDSDGSIEVIRMPFRRMRELKNSIRHIVDYTSTIFAPKLLESGPCPRLTTLELTFDYRMQEFIPKLKNAPALKNLILDHISISAAEIENIHVHCPKLSLLKITDGLKDIGKVPKKIKPVTSTTLLHLELTYKVDTPGAIHWLRYIHKKYKQLTHFTFRNGYEEPDSSGELARDGFIPLLKDFGPRLMSFETDLILLDSRFFKGIAPGNLKLTALNGPFIDKNCILKEKTLLSLFNFLQNVTLQELPDIDLAPLRQMLKLQNLSLCFGNTAKKRVDLADVLFNCPISLKSLTLKNTKVDCWSIQGDEFGVRSLVFEKCTLDETLDRFLSRRFPNLKSLTFRESVRFEANLVFGNFDLDYLEITAKDEFSDDYCMKEKVHFLVMTINDATNRLYCTGQLLGVRSYNGSSKLNDTNDIYILGRPMGYTFTDEAYITLVLGSVKTLVLNNFLVYNVPITEYPESEHDEEEDDYGRDNDEDMDQEMWSPEYGARMRAIFTNIGNVLRDGGDINEALASIRR